MLLLGNIKEKEEGEERGRYIIKYICVSGLSIRASGCVSGFEKLNIVFEIVSVSNVSFLELLHRAPWAVLLIQ